MAFITYIKEFSGRRSERSSKFERYFKEWGNAEKQLSEDTEEICKNGGTILEDVDYFNCEKGFTVRYKTFSLNGNKIVISLGLAYFDD